MKEVELSHSIQRLDKAYDWARKNCKSYKGNRLKENRGGWAATFVFAFEDDAEAIMFALKWK